MKQIAGAKGSEVVAAVAAACTAVAVVDVAADTVVGDRCVEAGQMAVAAVAAANSLQPVLA